MSRILFAWELGGGYGHLGPFRPIAEALLAQGHELTLAVRDVERAHAVFGSLADAARAFALKHREPSVDTIIERAADRIETLARGNPG